MENKKMNYEVLFAALLAAVYVALCAVLQPISFGPIQFRLSEMLCILSIWYPWAYAGICIGCLLANLFVGGLGMMDVVFGTLASVIGCGVAYYLRNKTTKGIPLLSLLSIIIFNGVIVGIELGIVFDTPKLIPLYILEVAIGEAGVLFLTYPIMKRLRDYIENQKVN